MPRTVKKQKEEEGYDYESDLRIDPNALDVEWLEQPMLFMRYAEELAYARTRMDRAKEKLDVVRAEVDNMVRKNPGDYFDEGTKVTNSAIDALVITNELYKEANDKLIEIRLEVELLSAAVRAMDQKKSALENLVRLLGQSYFAAPKEPRDLGVEMHQRAAAVGKEDARAKMRNKRRQK